MLGVQNPDTLRQANREYLESRILSAQPVVIVEMLYNVAVTNVKAAIEHLKSGDAMARSGDVTKAQEAVNELMLSIDHSVRAPFVSTLAALYAFVQQQLLKGHTTQSEEAFRKALSILVTLSEGWATVRAEVENQATKAAAGAGADAQEPQPEPVTVGGPAGSGARDPYADYRQEQPPDSRDWSA